MITRSRYWLSVAKQTSTRLIEDDCFGQAKGAAYSFLLFFFPLLLFLVSMLVVTDALAGLAPQLTHVSSRVLPPATRALLANYISAMIASESKHLLVGAFMVMVWTGSSLLLSFIEGLNRAYRVPIHRPLVKERLVATGLVFLVGIPLVLLALLAIFGSHLERFIAAQFDLTLSWFWRAARWGFVLAVTMVMIAIIYYVGPHRQQTWRGVLPGAGLATAVWILATFAFSAYVNHFGEYNVIYGSLGTGIVLLVWMYLSSLAVLIGGEFNAVLSLPAAPSVNSTT
ncbi:MAG: YihY/virulence factor BrkB family protein [Acidobacteria bacterium]|nr:YihY/virulence factor BrkB family protein [Acidobacteriota bacterium]